MAINVNYAPDINQMGQAAYLGGLGQYYNQQQARQDSNDLNWAQLQQHGQLAQQQLMAHQQAMLFGHAADLNRMAFGAGIENQQRQLQYDQQGQNLAATQQFEIAQRAQQQKFLEEQQARAAEYDKQQMLDRMNETGKQKYEQMNRERDHILSLGLTPDGEKAALQAHAAKNLDFDPMIYQIPKGQKYGDVISMGGHDYAVGPDGKYQKGGPTWVAPKDWFARNSIGFVLGEDGIPIDPVSKKRLAFTWNTSRGGYEKVKTEPERLPPDLVPRFYAEANKMAKAEAGFDDKGQELEADPERAHWHFRSMVAQWENIAHGTPIPDDLKPTPREKKSPAQPPVAGGMPTTYGELLQGQRQQPTGALPDPAGRTETMPGTPNDSRGQQQPAAKIVTIQTPKGTIQFDESRASALMDQYGSLANMPPELQAEFRSLRDAIRARNSNAPPAATNQANQ